jgi:hypothetical protein
MKIKLLAAVFLLFITSLHAQSTTAPTADSWKPLQFLMGTWEAKTAGKTEAAGTYNFALDLSGHIVSRSSHTASCKSASGLDCEHTDLLYIYKDGPANVMKAIYFDNEGHVLHYDVTTPSPTSVVFLTDAAQPGPQFKLTYELKDGVMSGKFQMKPPGAPAFVSYLEWSGGKK